MLRPRPPRATLFPYTTLFRSQGFKAAVDPTNPKVVYAATGAGLFRSSNGGRSFANVKLPTGPCAGKGLRDRKSTRLNSSHVEISYAVFCLKKKKKNTERLGRQ